MAQLKRVAVTGMGAICGLGHNLAQVWSELIQGHSGISLIQNIPTEDLSVKIAGEIKNFKIADSVLSAKDADHFDLFNHYALHAAHEAWEVSKLQEAPYSKERIGCILGVGLGGMPDIEKNHSALLEKGPRRVSPFFIPGIIANMASGLISIKLGLKGANFVVTSACASSAHALSVAAQEIMLGRADAIITGGAESVITRLSISGFASMKALSKRNEEPTKASRPFDQDRDGFVMGEGAGILILEDLEKAKARGATIYAEVVGHGLSSDAHHISAPHPDGEGAMRAMNLAIESAGISKSAIGYINAHGTSTPLGDVAETKALKKVFAEHAAKLAVSSTKSMTGHLLGAAGGLESIFCVMSLYSGVLPPTINLDKADPECDLDYIPHHSVKKSVEYALNNSFGFGGTNSSVIFKKFPT